MPFSSQSQWRKCFASGSAGWDCEKWAHETPGGKGTRFRKLPVKVSTKATNYHARAGQVIAGRLRRGASGKFESTGAAPATSAGRLNAARDAALRGGAKKQPPKAARSGKRAGRKPAKTEQQRAAEREQKRQQRQAEQDKKRQEAQAAKRAARDKILADAGLGASSGLAGALIDARDGNTIAPQNGEKLAQMGLAEQARDGSYRLTAAGREVVNAAERGDAGRVHDTMSQASDRAAAGRDRAAARANKPKGGGGGSKKKPPAVVRRTPTRSNRAPRPVSAGRAGGGGAQQRQAPQRSPYADIANKLSQGQTLTADEEDTLVRNGLARRNHDGSLSLTYSGQRATTQKAETYGGTKRSKLPDSVFAGPDRSFPIVTAQDVKDAVRSLGRTTHDKAAVKKGIIRRARAIGATDALPESWREKSSSFTVYKQRDGSYRWVAYSSNAYRDRDQEIVSTKALADDCARADSDGQYGPLRWWHVGGVAGPGWDLGMCDFNAMHGRVLVESGTFKSAAIGAAVARAAPHLQLSIGFTHAPDEPDAQGVFHHIRRFERSLVPTGRAANPFTKLVVKETHMDQEKETALKAALGDEAAAQVLAGAEQTQKDAEAQGVAYKSEQPDPWAAVVAALKAALAPAQPVEAPAPEPEPVAEKAGMMDMPMDEEKQGGDMGDGEMPMDDTGGEMSADEFLSAIGDLIDAKLAPLIDALGITQKLDGHFGELKAALGAFSKQKDDTDAARAQEIEALKAQVAELSGDVPPAFRDPFIAGVGGYRASQAADTVVTKAEAAAVGVPQTDDDPFADIRSKLFGSPNGHA